MNIGKTGAAGEREAAKMLIRKGFKILKKNFVTPFGEIDIIACNKDTLVFAEVKTRGENFMVSPAEAVTPSKQRKICKSADVYAAGSGNNLYKRFDIIEVYADGEGNFSVNHIENAFCYI